MARVPAFETMTRVGFAARGIVYGLIGWLALRSGRAEDGAGILDWLSGGGGDLVVAGMAVGFFGYGAWRLIEAWVDSEGRGSDARGLAVRVGGAASGFIHLGLGFLAVRVAGGGRAGDSAEDGAATALSLPGGKLVLLLGAAAILATGLYQLVKAYKLDFLRHLDPRAAARQWTTWLGRAGYAARGLVFLVIAWLLWRAAEAGRSAEAGGIDEALGSLPEPLAVAVAGGLLLFGLFSLVEARFRRIHTPPLPGLGGPLR